MYAPTSLRCFGITPRDLLGALLSGLPADATVTVQAGGVYVEHPSLATRMQIEDLVACQNGLVVASIWGERLDTLGVRFPSSWTMVWTHDREKGRIVRLTRGEEIILDARQEDDGSYALDARGAAVFRGEPSTRALFDRLLEVELATLRAGLGEGGIALDGAWPDQAADDAVEEDDDAPF